MQTSSLTSLKFKSNLNIAITSIMLGTLLMGTVNLALAANDQSIESKKQQLQIAAGSLDQALAQLAGLTHTELSYDPSLVSGKKTKGLNGSYNFQQGIAELLKETGLSLIRHQDGTWSIIDLKTQIREVGQLQSIHATAQSSTDFSPASLPIITLKANDEKGLSPIKGYIARKSITATKSDIALIESPQTVSSVSADQIAIQNADSLSTSLAYTPGVQALGNVKNLTSDGMVIRGFNLTGSSPMYLNGSKLARNTFSGTAEPYALERIEILKGPASVLYGNAAPGGIINMISKLPQTENAGEVQIKYGSYDKKQVAADSTGALNDDKTLSYRLTGLVRRSDTFVDYIPDDRNFFQGAITWQPDPTTSLTFIANHQLNNTKYYYGLPEQGTVTDNPNGKIATSRFLGEPDFNRFKTDNSSIGYLFSHQFNDIFSFRQNLLFFKSKTNYSDLYLDDFTDNSKTSVMRGAYTRFDRDSSLAIDNQLQAKWSSQLFEHTALIGIDYNKQKFQREQYLGTAAPLNIYHPIYGSIVNMQQQPIGSGKETSDQLGFYLQEHLKIDQKWVVTGGLRYDQVKSDNLDYLTQSKTQAYDENALTGRLGFVYLANNGIAPYLSYAQSFEPVQGQTYDGSPFQPSKGKQYEFGLRYEPQNRNYSVVASLYNLIQTNVSTSDLQHPLFSTQQGEVQSKGVELEAKFHFDQNINLIASYNYIDNKVTKSNDKSVGNRMASLPRQTASFWVDQKYQDKYLAGLGIRYIGESTNNSNTIQISSYTLVDAVLGYDVSNDLSLKINFNNLFNKTYVGCTYACLYGEPRNITGTIIYKW